MKYLRFEEESFVFSINSTERDALRLIVDTYPRAEGALKPARSDADPAAVEQQELLEEALAEHRAAAREEARAILQTEGRFTLHGRKILLRLSKGELHCLLSVTNNVRVGCWRALGSPDPPRVAWWEMPTEQARDGFLMDACGVIQIQLLHAIGHG